MFDTVVAAMFARFGWEIQSFSVDTENDVPLLTSTLWSTTLYNLKYFQNVF